MSARDKYFDDLLFRNIVGLPSPELGLPASTTEQADQEVDKAAMVQAEADKYIRQVQARQTWLREHPQDAPDDGQLDLFGGHR